MKLNDLAEVFGQVSYSAISKSITRAKRNSDIINFVNEIKQLFYKENGQCLCPDLTPIYYFFIAPH